MREKRWLIAGLIFLGLAVLLAAVLLLSQAQPAIEKTRDVTLEVKPAPDFTLDVQPVTLTTYVGRVVAYTATVTPVNDFAGQVVFSVEGLPAGITATILPAAEVTVGGGPAGVQVNISVGDDDTLVGTYTLTIRARSTQYN